MGGIFWLFLRVLVTPKVEKTTPGGPGAALDHPPLAGLNACEELVLYSTSQAIAYAGHYRPPKRGTGVGSLGVTHQ